MSRRGELWFGAQLIALLALLGAPLVQRGRPPFGVRFLGLGVLTGGVTIAVAGYRQLGDNHSPWTTPREGGSLVTTGIYARTRNPIYLGWCASGLGLEIIVGSWLGVSVAGGVAVFYDLKARAEERRLVEHYSGPYDSYRAEVKRFVPGLY